jgi:hypothetical protein
MAMIPFVVFFPLYLARLGKISGWSEITLYLLLIASLGALCYSGYQ